MTIREKISLWADDEPHLSILPIVCFIGGVLVYFLLPFEPKIIPVLLGICICFSLLFICKSDSTRFLLTFPLLFCCGIGVCLAHTAFTQTRTLPFVLENVRVYGKITSVDITLGITRIDVAVDKITKKDIIGKEVNALKRNLTPQVIRLSTQEENIRVGDVISGFVRRLSPPQLPLTPFGNNEARKLWFDGIGATGFVSAIQTPKSYKRLAPENTFISSLRKTVQERIFKTASFENAGVITALILGNTHLVSTSSKLLYRDLGISHILAISGFHIGLIALFIFSLTRFLLNVFLPYHSPMFIKRTSVIPALLIAGFYVYVSGAHPPAVRAYIMIFAYFLAILIDRHAEPIRSLFLAAFIILCYKPVLLMDLGFELSFISVLCLISVCSKAMKYFKARSRLKKLMMGLLCLIFFNLLVSLSSAPFVLYAFHQIPLYGVLGNLLLSSLFAFAIIPLSFLSMATLFIEPLSAFLITCVDSLLTLVRFVGMPITFFPHATIYVPYFHAFGLILWAVGMIGLALFQTKIRYVFCLFLCLAPLSFLNVEKPIALIGAGGKFIGFRQHNTYYETESYYYKNLHKAWLTYNGLNPEKEHILHLTTTNSPLVSFSESTCASALLYINPHNVPNKCPHQIFPFQIDRWQTLLIYRHKKDIRFRRACETDSNRPWGVYCPNIALFTPE